MLVSGRNLNTLDVLADLPIPTSKVPVNISKQMARELAHGYNPMLLEAKKATAVSDVSKIYYS